MFENEKNWERNFTSNDSKSFDVIKKKNFLSALKNSSLSLSISTEKNIWFLYL